MTVVRKEQSALSAQEWQDFISAVNAMHGTAAKPPAYRQFVMIHVDAMSNIGMSWGVHTMPGMPPGRNFLAWHRQFLIALEGRLAAERPGVTIPYWDWIANPNPPKPLSSPALLTSWSVTRSFDPSQMPIQQDLDAVNLRTKFTPFQTALEQVHGAVHNAVGGTMKTAYSPADPLFFLHHANIDRLWDVWARKHARAKPPNTTEKLQPTGMFGMPVSQLLNTTKLGYRYM
jgi:tyrosinase